jgi:hypothetical protein
LFLDSESSATDKRDPVTEARARCHTLIERTNSVAKLESMAKVLRALSSD